MLGQFGRAYWFKTAVLAVRRGAGAKALVAVARCEGRSALVIMSESAHTGGQ
jgi:hypothetical protein